MVRCRPAVTALIRVRVTNRN
ncbi:MAG: hypothetical protein JWN47_313, partial [Frankiales bacterium]|nr:hypothetical protein [Frankiales bacterium]